MADRRMFSKHVIDSDAFLDMPLTTQCLYFHLSMRADDDGFVNNPKKIQRMVGASEDDMKVLLAKSFLIPFESGIVVIRHWKIHNYLRSDRYKATQYTDEKAQLVTKENGEYEVGIPSDNQMVYQLDTQVRLGKDRLGKDRLEDGNRKRFSPPTLDEVIAYKSETNSNVDPQKFVDYYESKGWKVGNAPMKNWQAAFRNWGRKDFGGSSNTALHPFAAQNYTQRQYSGDLRNIFEDDEEVT